MENGFETWWELQGIRFEAGGHKERAQHAYEAGVEAGRQQPVQTGFWLDELEPKKEEA